MGLEYNLSKIADRGALVANVRTEAMIFGCWYIGIGEITEENVEEWATRIEMWQKVVGPLYRDGNGEPKWITLDVVRRYIGLHTNVFPKVTDAAYGKKLAGILLDDAKRKIKREKEAAPDGE